MPVTLKPFIEIIYNLCQGINMLLGTNSLNLSSQFLDTNVKISLQAVEPLVKF